MVFKKRTVVLTIIIVIIIIIIIIIISITIIIIVNIINQGKPKIQMTLVNKTVCKLLDDMKGLKEQNTIIDSIVQLFM